MVGLVIVSHSHDLARALAGLVSQVATVKIPICGVGGVGDGRREFGTDATDIAQAVTAVSGTGGVAVLMDLGSAVLSAETALDLVPAEMRPLIRLCAGPLVEGAIAAGVQISLGSNLETVCQAARHALGPKIEQLAESPDEPGKSDGRIEAEQSPVGRKEIQLTVDIPHGLHARPAARFVQTAARFDAQVHVQKAGLPSAPVPATSLNSLTTLGIRQGDRILVSAQGPEAAQALKTLQELVDEQLTIFSGHPAQVPATAVPLPTETGAMAAIAVSEGIALGPLFHFQAPPPELSRHRADTPDQEWAQLESAIEAAAQAIQTRRQTTRARLGENQAAIFEAHGLILQDPILLDQVRRRIITEGQNAALAWQRSVDALAAAYGNLDDAYLRQRAIDVRDVGHQVLICLLGQDTPAVAAPPQPAILVARELTPAATAALDADQVLGLVTVSGGPTSHSAIIARALGIPAVAGVDPAVLQMENGTPLGLDGFSGTLWVRPSPMVADRLRTLSTDWRKRRQTLHAAARQPAVTRDGHRVRVSANIANVPQADTATASGAEGIGLLRTEFLYLTRSRPPAETEQMETLRQIGRQMAGGPICVRTLDVGGDKFIPYLPLVAEANPYLGLRAIRLSLRHPDLLRCQMRAVLQAAAEFDLRLMVPMITTLEEVDRVLAMLAEEHGDLQRARVAHRWPLPTGMMVETPAAVELMSALARRLDFFSIGTNDLTQYSLAAERGNPDLASYADALHPVILRMIKRVVAEAHRHAKPVCVCGELAADPAAVPVLVGLDVDELSLTPAAIPAVKAVICALDFRSAVVLADTLLATDTAPGARRRAEAFLKKDIRQEIEKL